MENPKKIIGILGGIGSGKSSVAGEFIKLGCAVISADELAWQLLNENGIKSKLANIFGHEIFDNKRNINRVKISEYVFSCRENVEKINAVLHPPILYRTKLLIDKYTQCEEIAAIVLDMPLLLEVGWQDKCDILIFVEASEENRIKRVAENYPENAKNLKKRENFQISLDKKAKIAHYTVINNSDLTALAEQVVRIFSIIINE